MKIKKIVSRITVDIKSPTLDEFLGENDLSGCFMKPENAGVFDPNGWYTKNAKGNKKLAGWLRDYLNLWTDDGLTWQAELKPNLILSLLEIVAPIEKPFWGGEDEKRTMRSIREFLEKNHSMIEKDAEGNITILEADLEDEMIAYYQRVEGSCGHGKLIQWPCSEGWTEKGSAAIRKYSTYTDDKLWEIIQDDQALAVLAGKEGETTEF